MKFKVAGIWREELPAGCPYGRLLVTLEVGLTREAGSEPVTLEVGPTKGAGSESVTLEAGPTKEVKAFAE
jgi:hypothetical protein